jgi:hypothetical protein
MSHRSRAFAVALTILLAGSATGSTAQVAIQIAQPLSSTPIAGHPPVTVTGVAATFDPDKGIFRLDDGRMVQLTGESKIVVPLASPIRPGDIVTLRDVLPIGVQSGLKTLAVGQPQRMGTIASVDEERGLLQLTDGTLVRVDRTTNLHLGASSSNVALAQVSAGDELVVVLGSSGAPVERRPGDDGAPSPSALAREDAAPTALEAGEVMVFRVPRRP